MFVLRFVICNLKWPKDILAHYCYEIRTKKVGIFENFLNLLGKPFKELKIKQIAMNPVIRNFLAVLAGWFVGSAVNMGLVLLGDVVVGAPAGVDMTTAEGLKNGMHLLQPQHFVFPFLAHALGTLIGAFLAAKLAANRKMIMALIVGVVFLLGGIAMVTMVPSPTWFTVLDLVMAYIPMAWLGGKLAGAK